MAKNSRSFDLLLRAPRSTFRSRRLLRLLTQNRRGVGLGFFLHRRRARQAFVVRTQLGLPGERALVRAEMGVQRVLELGLFEVLIAGARSGAKSVNGVPLHAQKKKASEPQGFER